MLKCWSHQTSPITLQKWCFDPSQVLQLLAAPPPPQSMLESNTGKRAHATGCTFPTLIGGAGGPPEGGKVSHFFLTQKIRFLNALFLRRTGRILEEPEFFPCNTFFGRFTSSRRSRRIFYFRFRRDGAHMTAFLGGSSHDSTRSLKKGYPRFWVAPRNFCASSFELTPSCVALAA